jgi:hypothetical protein
MSEKATMMSGICEVISKYRFSFESSMARILLICPAQVEKLLSRSSEPCFLRVYIPTLVNICAVMFEVDSICAKQQCMHTSFFTRHAADAGWGECTMVNTQRPCHA